MVQTRRAIEEDSFGIGHLCSHAASLVAGRAMAVDDGFGAIASSIRDRKGWEQ